MAESYSTAGTNGETFTTSAHPHAAQVKENLRAAGTAASEAVRDRATKAQDWARGQVGTIQGTVEAEPYRATVWALGLGFVAGIVLTSLVRR